jgi:broad specificity polyphosphatase/5'/3'-nucleotidase SurE
VSNVRVLVTNDDGIDSEGLRWLATPALDVQTTIGEVGKE